MAEHTPTPWGFHDANMGYLDGVDWDRARACTNAFHSDDGRQIENHKITPGLFWEMRDLLVELMEHEDPGCGEDTYDRTAALLAKLEDGE